MLYKKLVSDNKNCDFAFHGSIRSADFNVLFIVFPTIAALLFGTLYAVMEFPAWLVLLSIWILGYPHSVATFTQLYGDSKVRRKHWFLAYGLPPICVAIVFWADRFYGLLVPMGFLLGRSFHYIRQSHGFARILSRQDSRGLWYYLGIYLSPLLSFMAYLAVPRRLLDFTIPALPVYVPIWVGPVVGVAALFAIGSRPGPRQGVALGPRFFFLMYLSSHIAIFSLGYLLNDQADGGILMLTTWHSLQHLLFVWQVYDRRAGIQTAEARTQSKWIPFVAIVFGGSLTLHGGFAILDEWLLVRSFFIATMAINLHHYISESFIWRRQSFSIFDESGLRNC